MVSSFLWLFIPLNMVPAVGVNAAYTMHTQAAVAPDKTDCCGRCKNGVITHGDGHTTPCQCPASCKCKAKTMVHEPICITGTCKKPSK